MSTFNLLPYELIIKIILFCEFDKIKELRLLNKYFFNLIDTNNLLYIKPYSILHEPDFGYDLEGDLCYDFGEFLSVKADKDKKKIKFFNTPIVNYNILGKINYKCKFLNLSWKSIYSPINYDEVMVTLKKNHLSISGHVSDGDCEYRWPLYDYKFNLEYKLSDWPIQNDKYLVNFNSVEIENLTKEYKNILQNKVVFQHWIEYIFNLNKINSISSKHMHPNLNSAIELIFDIKTN